jgi:choline dehydrogenase-like flavoprotein
MQTQPENPLKMDEIFTDAFDFIIIGAGIGGTVVASRLHERDPSLSILLIEAGPDSSTTPLAETVATPIKAPLLWDSELDWNYKTIPQKNIGGAELSVRAGKAMGGGSVINAGWSNNFEDMGCWNG